MLISAEHEIQDAKNINEIQHFSGSDKPRMLFFLLINVKMPTIVGILTFMCLKKFMLSRAEQEKYVYYIFTFFSKANQNSVEGDTSSAHCHKTYLNQQTQQVTPPTDTGRAINMSCFYYPKVLKYWDTLNH